MRSVSRFEAEMLRVLHAVLGRAPIGGAVPAIADRHPRPPCLGRDAVDLARDALAKGCALRLARLGGWHRGRFLRGDRPVDGRLWERRPPASLGLSFSRHSLDFLIWIVAEHPGDKAKRWAPPEGELTLGDRLLLFFAYEALQPTGLAVDLATNPPFGRHGLCRLAFPADFGDDGGMDGPDFAPWVAGDDAWVLETLQPRLAELWTAVERQKRRIQDAGKMRALGWAQGQALEAFLRAAEAAGRRDLARFVLRAAADLLRGGPKGRDWVEGLDLEGTRMADRTETYRAATAFLRSLDRLQGWERDARAVGYFDEGYAAAQLWKADWEAADGETLCVRAREIARALEPF